MRRIEVKVVSDGDFLNSWPHEFRLQIAAKR